MGFVTTRNKAAGLLNSPYSFVAVYEGVPLLSVRGHTRGPGDPVILNCGVKAELNLGVCNEQFLSARVHV